MDKILTQTIYRRYLPVASKHEKLFDLIHQNKCKLKPQWYITIQPSQLAKMKKIDIIKY